MKPTKYYTGVGSRDTPEDITDLMSDLAVILYNKEYVLRSGRAEGADYAFQRGAEYALKQPLISSNTVTRQEIYLPQRNFNTCFGDIGAINTWELPTKLVMEAKSIIEDVHPKGRNLHGFALNAHTRNVFQVLGRDLKTPSEFVVYWAIPKDKYTVKGGTNTAVQVARMSNIPTYNLYIKEQREEICKLISM